MNKYLAAATAALSFAPLASPAQDYPTRPVRVVVPKSLRGWSGKR
jgi:tripartite-type tricarboxylate transporter receptor subunit TctC